MTSSERPTAEIGGRERVVVAHPDDVNLADVKSMAADHNTTIVGNRYCPRGQAFLMDARNLRIGGDAV